MNRFDSDVRVAVVTAEVESWMKIIEIRMSNMWQIATALGCALVLTSVGFGQDESIAPQEPTAAEQHFQQVISRVGDALRESASYELKATTQWSVQVGDSGAKGKAIAKLQRFQDRRFRLEVQNPEENQPQLIVSYDGQSELRYLPMQSIYVKEETDEPLHAVQDCAFTQSALKLCGINFLMTPNTRAWLDSNLVRVVELGDSEVDGIPVERFELLFHDGQRTTVAFRKQAPPLPLQLVIQRVVTLPEDVTNTLAIETRLAWNLEATLDENELKIEVPESALAVDDLAEGVLTGDSAALIGEKLPEISLQLPADDQSQQLQVTGPTVLYFWATWAAPSIEEIPRMNQFVADMKKKGVDVIAVDVAEDPSLVAEFIKINDFEGDVRIDSSGEAVEALRLSHLPAVVLVDSQRTIIAIREQSNRTYEPVLRDAIERLLEKK